MRPGFEIGTDGPSRILVGVDGTESSLRAGSYAAGLARRQGSHLIVLYVWPPAALAAQSAATAGAVLQTQQEIADQLRTSSSQRTADAGIDAEFVLRQGNPYQELLKVADEFRVDAVVDRCLHPVRAALRRLAGRAAGARRRLADHRGAVIPVLSCKADVKYNRHSW